MSSSAPLTGRVVALSISDSPDLGALGFGPAHLLDAMIELARGLLRAGATLAYGGDLRPGGFTTILHDLVRAESGGTTEPRVRSYLAWPLHEKLTRMDRTSLLNFVDLRELPSPAKLVPDPGNPPPDLDEGLALALSLTSMRMQMARECDARITLGGAVTGWVGRHSGLLEEAVYTLRGRSHRQGASDESLLYVLGGFGGAAACIVEALQGQTPPEWEPMRLRSDPKVGDLHARIDVWVAGGPGRGEPSDPALLLDELAAIGLAGLDNGLSLPENERLATTPHVPEMVALVLKGLVSKLRP